MNIQLLHNVLAMCRNRMNRNAELLGNLLVSEKLAYEIKNLLFSLRYLDVPFMISVAF